MERMCNYHLLRQCQVIHCCIQIDKMYLKIRRDKWFSQQKNVKWKFILSRAPWWGSQYERMVGINSLYKSIGSSNLTWSELEEVLLDVEVTINNRFFVM